MAKKYGLDFGTTNSAIAIDDKGIGRVLNIDDLANDPRVIRSMVYFFRRELRYRKFLSKQQIALQIFKEGDIYYEGEQKSAIGQRAIEEYLEDNVNRSAGIRRKIFTGRMVRTRDSVEAKSDFVAEYYEEVDYGTGRLMQALKTALKSRFYKGSSVFGHYFTLEELIGIFIKHIKERADEIVGEKVTEVKVGRPVHFLDDPSKDKETQGRLETALRNAGFKKIEFEFEPIGAARQFLVESGQNNKYVFIFDFGGGTLDTAVVRKTDKFEVLASDGVYIGGDLLNADIMQAKLWPIFGSRARYGDHGMEMPMHVYESLRSWFSIPNLNSPETMDLLERVRYKNSDKEGLDRLLYLIRMNIGFGLYEAIEKAKKELSTQDSARIIFQDGPIDIDERITRLEFEKIIFPRVKEIAEVVLRTLSQAGVSAEQVDVVVRTGGSSLIPIFEKMLVEIFGKDKLKQFETFTSIAAGLSLESS